MSVNIDRPFFSIIIPTFNSSSTISNAISSLTAQQFFQFEIIVIDGLSTDSTIDIIKGFKDARIMVKSERDSGVYDAMNKGIMKAASDWLYFLGSDDELYNAEILKDIYNLIISNKSTKVIYGNVLINGDTGWGRNGQVYDGEFTVEKLLKVNISHQAIFYHKEVFRKCGKYNLDYKICADYDFNLRAASQFKFVYVNKIVARFNANGTSTNAVDIVFGDLFNNNIINYFMFQLYKTPFEKFERLILRRSITDLKSLKITAGIYLMFVGTYLRAKRILRSNFKKIT